MPTKKKKAKSRRKAYTLIDVEKYNPGVSSPTELKRGDVVKLSFQGKDRRGKAAAESMWVLVTKGSGKTFEGTLDSMPVMLPLKYKDRITFKPKHVINVMRIPGRGD